MPHEKELDQREQFKAFDKGMSLFHRGDFAKARKLLEEVIGGPSREMSHAAQMHIRMCDRRLASTMPELKTAEDHYNYAVALMNQGRLGEAEPAFRAGLRLEESADHIHYGLALCCALRGNLPGASDHMGRAIELRPHNRATARSDPDFQPFLTRPPLSEVLFPERNESG